MTSGTRSRTAQWLAVCAVLLGAHPRMAGAAFLPLEEIPTESPVYPALERLSSRYGATVGFPHTRPWTVADVSGFLDALVKSGCGCVDDPTFIRVRREVEPDESTSSPLVRLVDEGTTLEVSPYLRVGHREDVTREPGVIRDHRIGATAAVGRGATLLVFADGYLATYSPEPHGNPITGTRHAIVEGTDFNQWFDRAYVNASAGGFSARLGHTWLRWGPGRSGTLGLYDGSLALDVAEFRWRMLSRAQLTWFVAALDAYEEEYLAGHRLEVRAGSSLVFGVAELARFSGAPLAPLYFVPVIGFTLREKQVSRFSDTSADTLGARSRNNVLWTADLEWRVAPGLSAYGEVLLDDWSFSSDYRPTEMGYQLGGRWTRRLGERDAVTVCIEHTRITNFTYSSEHGHDFASDGFPLAFPYGPDVEVQSGALSWTQGPDWTWDLDVSRVRKGEGEIGTPWDRAEGRVDNFPLSGSVERRVRVAVGAAYSPSRRIRARAELGWTAVSAYRHQPTDSIDRWTGSSSVTFQW